VVLGRGGGPKGALDTAGFASVEGSSVAPAVVDVSMVYDAAGVVVAHGEEVLTLCLSGSLTLDGLCEGRSQHSDTSGKP